MLKFLCLLCASLLLDVSRRMPLAKIREEQVPNILNIKAFII